MDQIDAEQLYRRILRLTQDYQAIHGRAMAFVDPSICLEAETMTIHRGVIGWDSYGACCWDREREVWARAFRPVVGRFLVHSLAEAEHVAREIGATLCRHQGCFCISDPRGVPEV